MLLFLSESCTVYREFFLAGTCDDDVDEVVRVGMVGLSVGMREAGSHHRLDFGSRSVQRYKPPDTSTTDTHDYQWRRRCRRGQEHILVDKDQDEDKYEDEGHWNLFKVGPICIKLVGATIICLSSEGSPGQDGSTEILRSSKGSSVQELSTIWTNCVKYPKAMVKNYL